MCQAHRLIRVLHVCKEAALCKSVLDISICYMGWTALYYEIAKRKRVLQVSCYKIHCDLSDSGNLRIWICDLQF